MAQPNWEARAHQHVGGDEPGGDPWAPTSAQTRADQLLIQVLTLDQLAAMPPPEPIVAGWLFRDTLAWLQGKWGQAKSFLAVDLACCIATGTNWHGNATVQTRVLYLVAEGATGMAQRVQAWEQLNHRKVGNWLRFLPVPVQLADPNGVDVAAMRILLEKEMPGVVVLDTQARCTVGADENSSKDMGKFVDNLENLRPVNRVTFLIVHHEPRNGENLRGSVALEGAAETIIRTKREETQVTVECLKAKNTAEPEPFVLELQSTEDSAALVDGIDGAPEAVPANQRKILEVLHECPPPDYDMSAAELRKSCDVPESSFYREVNRLVRKGKVFRTGAKTRYRYSIPEPDRQEETL